MHCQISKDFYESANNFNNVSFYKTFSLVSQCNAILKQTISQINNNECVENKNIIEIFK